MSGEQPGWEYRWLDAADEGRLTSLGERGWEVIGSSSDSNRLLLKRAKPTFRERVTLDQKRHVYHSAGIALPEEDR
jgi:hypothetical protein